MKALLDDMLGDVTCGDCTDIMEFLPRHCIDFCLTDPPYLVRYRDRGGRRLLNDSDGGWVGPAFRQIHRILKADAFCVSFYGWNNVEIFMDAWKTAGFVPLGHIVFPKPYASNARYLRYQHEQAYLLGKGSPPMPDDPLPDVLGGWSYTGNRLHPTQKPLSILRPLIESLTEPGAIVLDPFCGSGSTLKAAQQAGRRPIGIELDPAHARTARSRLEAPQPFGRTRPLGQPRTVAA